jgi:hypothetical protein
MLQVVMRAITFKSSGLSSHLHLPLILQEYVAEVKRQQTVYA